MDKNNGIAIKIFICVVQMNKVLLIIKFGTKRQLINAPIFPLSQ